VLEVVLDVAGVELALGPDPLGPDPLGLEEPQPAVSTTAIAAMATNPGRTRTANRLTRDLAMEPPPLWISFTA
jgi:hypothetical protein